MGSSGASTGSSGASTGRSGASAGSSSASTGRSGASAGSSRASTGSSRACAGSRLDVFRRSKTSNFYRPGLYRTVIFGLWYGSGLWRAKRLILKDGLYKNRYFCVLAPGFGDAQNGSFRKARARTEPGHVTSRLVMSCHVASRRECRMARHVQFVRSCHVT